MMKMATKKSSSTVGGGFLVFLGSLVYLYVVFTWAGQNGAGSSPAWLASYATFWTPIVAAVAVISAITLFFKGIKGMAGMLNTSGKHPVLWKFTNIGGIAILVLMSGSASFLWAVLGFVLTYLGAMWVSM